jgi:hypothetical protein
MIKDILATLTLFWVFYVYIHIIYIIYNMCEVYLLEL